MDLPDQTNKLNIEKLSALTFYNAYMILYAECVYDTNKLMNHNKGMATLKQKLYNSKELT